MSGRRPLGEIRQRSTNTIDTYFAQQRKELGKLRTQRTRIRQRVKLQSNTDVAIEEQINLVNLLSKTNKKITSVEKCIKNTTICKQVYDALNMFYVGCPWPVPPWAILKHISCSSDAEMFAAVLKSQKFNNLSKYHFEEVARVGNNRRYFAFQRDHKYTFSSKALHQFLLQFKATELNEAATEFVELGSTPDESDLPPTCVSVMQFLRDHRELLLLEDDASLTQYQHRLRQMHTYGMIHLNFPVPTSNDSVKGLKSRIRKCMAQLRESKKREERAQACAQRFQEAKDRVEKELHSNKKLLELARSQLAAFRRTHPDWRPPEDILPSADGVDLDEDLRHMFRVVDADLDVAAQMKIDPSGAHPIT